jgi:hypothetical protein
MTPKEKAQDLVNKFRLSAIFTDSYVKAIAKTAVDEILLSRKDDTQFDDTLWKGGSDMYTMHPMYLNYWTEVKQEIENL